jgi:hypothetical protein
MEMLGACSHFSDTHLVGAIRFGWPWLRRPRGLTLAAAVCALALATIGAPRYV